MAELYTAARAASRVRETPASILFRIGVIFRCSFLPDLHGPRRHGHRPERFRRPAHQKRAAREKAEPSDSTQVFPCRSGLPGTAAAKTEFHLPAAARRRSPGYHVHRTRRTALCLQPLPEKNDTLGRYGPRLLRQPWEKLRSEFISIYQSKNDGPLAAKALRKAAECQRHLAGCSHLGEDYRLAVKIYEAATGNIRRISSPLKTSMTPILLPQKI